MDSITLELTRETKCRQSEFRHEKDEEASKYSVSSQNDPRNRSKSLVFS